MLDKFLTTEESITHWFKDHNIKNYTLILDSKYGFIVDVDGGVNLSNKNLTHIPIKFNHVTGDFDCGVNQLTSLEFCPSSVGGAFYCDHNQLTSLEFCPSTVGGDFYCNHNPALKEIQQINDFNEIYQRHREYLITQSYHKIDSQLTNHYSQSRKIKI